MFYLSWVTMKSIVGNSQSLLLLRVLTNLYIEVPFRSFEKALFWILTKKQFALILLEMMGFKKVLRAVE